MALCKEVGCALMFDKSNPLQSKMVCAAAAAVQQPAGGAKMDKAAVEEAMAAGDKDDAPGACKDVDVTAFKESGDKSGATQMCGDVGCSLKVGTANPLKSTWACVEQSKTPAAPVAAAKGAAAWCETSKTQKCTKLCPEPQCKAGSCARRSGNCCDYKCSTGV